MGFLDKLLGRSKDVAEDVGGTAKEYGDKAVDVAKEGAEKVEGAFGDDKSPATGEAPSQVEQAEQGVDEVRDQVAKDEGRIP